MKGSFNLLILVLVTMTFLVIFFLFANNVFHETSESYESTEVKSCDLNGDGVVDIADVKVWLLMGRTDNLDADLNSDGVVNSKDLQYLFSNFGPVSVQELKKSSGDQINGVDEKLDLEKSVDEDKQILTANITFPINNQVFMSGTKNTTLFVITNELATCRWSDIDNIYSEMLSANAMSGSGTTNHASTLTGLQDGTSYTRYVRCMDVSGNAMKNSASVVFSVQEKQSDFLLDFPKIDTDGCNWKTGEGCNPNVCNPGRCWYVSLDGNDNNSGTLEEPLRNISLAISKVQNGDTLYIREGEYRLIDWGRTRIYGRDATSDSHITIAGYPGERAILLGGLSTEGKIWVQYQNDIWRIPADYLNSDPTSMFLFEEGHIRSKRIDHQSNLTGGRNHASVINLTMGRWTKADADGLATCFSKNQGCYIYYYAESGINPNDYLYEISQRGAFYSIGTHYLTFKNIETYYTQSAGIFTEGCNNIEIAYSTFGHNSNSNDNSYSLRIWSGGGAWVHHNVVFDSKYWGGVSNSKGITFMVSNPDNPNIVEYNYIYDIPGQAAIGTKGGVANLIARYNVIKNSHTGVEPGGYRCSWKGCDPPDGAYYPGGGWQIYGNIFINVSNGIHLPRHNSDSHNHAVINNLFYGGKTGIGLGWNGSHGNEFANNIFMKNQAGIYLSSGGVTTKVEDYLSQYESHHNLFYQNELADIHLRPNWGGNYHSGTSYNVTYFQEIFTGREEGSISTDPIFVDELNHNFYLKSISPAKNAGDGSYYGLSSVDIGAYPSD